MSALPEETLNIDKRADAIARYEYEYTLLYLAKTLSAQENLRNVSGLSFREGNNITHNPGRYYIENLDELPFVSKVYKKNFSGRIENYFNPNALYSMVTITTSRGCPLYTFCVYPQILMGRGFRLIRTETSELE